MAGSQTRIRIERTTIEVPFFREKLTEDIELEMMQIPAGEFLMGSPEDELDNYDDEQPQHRVTVPSFFMAKYPVTQEQWRFVVGLPQVDIELKPTLHFEGDKRPVQWVNWHAGIEFCKRLSNYTGRTYRLPSEAEWEYACRAGTTTPFHFGETISTNLANYQGTDDEDNDRKGNYGQGEKGVYREEPTPIDHFGVANNFGLCEMHGNVWEWCLDYWHDNYDGAPTDGRAWLNENGGRNHVMRGGSWFYDPHACRSASRFHLPDDRSADTGFRVVCVP